MPQKSHDRLVKHAIRWLLGRGGCSIAFSEFSTSAFEIPDAIGWKSRWSKVIECKTSRADFFADRRKPTVRISKIAMGSERYYMVPTGLVAADEILDGWGLLYISKNRVTIVKPSEVFRNRYCMGEIGFLVSMLRRIKIQEMNLKIIPNEGVPRDVLNQKIKSYDYMNKQHISTISRRY
jgi:hypothetical protein